MPTSKCSKCENTDFELVSAKIKFSSFNLNFIQCTRCGSVVGVIEDRNINYALDKLASKLHVNINEK